VKKGNLSWDKIQPICSLWEEYAARLSESEPSVAKMDLHGAKITVTTCPDPSLVGISGAIVKESFGALIIVTRDNEVKQVNKNHTLIDVETPKGHYEINLGGIRCRPYLKATKRWKQRIPVLLPY
jgi:RNase P/RNase MRP subunit p29